jgi:hypothetical protein
MIIDEWKIENAKGGIGGTKETNGARGWRALGGTTKDSKVTKGGVTDD